MQGSSVCDIKSVLQCADTVCTEQEEHLHPTLVGSES